MGVFSWETWLCRRKVLTEIILITVIAIINTISNRVESLYCFILSCSLKFLLFHSGYKNC